MIRERAQRAANGYLALALLLGAGALAGHSLFRAVVHQSSPRPILLWALAGTAVLLCLTGLFVVNPNEARVLTLFGKYTGTVKSDGFWWANPFAIKKRISLRVRNFETAKLKVNDAHSNPIEIAAIVVWKVVETAEAMFEVDNFEEYVRIQSESALRALAQSYPYDAHTSGEVALSTHTPEVSKGLLEALHERLARAGVEATEARISHLAYSPEIASAMLQRQQASAIIAARQKIVEGAVGMVENALELLTKNGVVRLDEERKAAMVSNLLVVLCGERSAQPVLNTGTLYQ
jgi:regulator of protease activity HflC (stomatin/prohibitin superfamily)